MNGIYNSRFNTDSSANKLRHTYVKGYVDISGGDLNLQNGIFTMYNGKTSSAYFSIQNDGRMWVTTPAGQLIDLSLSQLALVNTISGDVDGTFNVIKARINGITHNADFNIDDTLIGNGGLTVTGTKFKSDNYAVFLKDVSINGVLNVNKDASFNSRLFVNNDVSFNSKLAVMLDTSLNSRLSVNNDVSFNSKLSVRLDVSLNSRLFVNNDASFNSKLTVILDTSLNSRLSVNNDASFNSKLMVMLDTSLNSRLFVNNDVSFNSKLRVMLDVSLNSRLSVNNDASFNSKLMVMQDVSLNSRLFVNNDASFNSKLTVGLDASLNSRLSVSNDVSFNSKLMVMLDTSLNSRLFVNNDVSFNSRLFVKNFVSIGKSSPLMSLDISYVDGIRLPTGTTNERPIKVVGTNSFQTQTGTTISVIDKSMYTGTIRYNTTKTMFEGFGPDDSWGSLGGVINVAQNTKIIASSPSADSSNNELIFYTAPTGNLVTGAATERMRIAANGDISMNDKLFVRGDVSFNSNFTVVGNVKIDNTLTMKIEVYSNGGANQGAATTIIPNTSIVEINGGTSFNNYSLADGYFDGQTIKIVSDQLNSSGLNLYGKLYFDQSLNSCVPIIFKNSYQSFDAIWAGGVWIVTAWNGVIFSNSNIMFGTSNSGDIEIIPAGKLYVNGRATIVNDVSFNSKLFVASDVSFNSRLYVLSDVSFNSRLFVGGALTVTGTAALNDNVTIASGKTLTLLGTGATSLGGALTVTGDLTVTGNTIFNGGNSTLNSNVSISSGKTLTLLGTGATSLGGALTVTGDLTVTGNTIFNGGNSTLNSNVSISSGKTLTLLGTGATSLGGALTVTGITTFNGATSTLNSNVSISSGKTLTLLGTGATSLGGALTVTGMTTLNDNVSVAATRTFTVGTGPTSLGGSLTVTGSTILNGTTALNDNVTIASGKTLTLLGTGATSLGGALTVTGAASLGSLTVTGAASLGSLTVTGTGATSLGGSLAVTGATTFTLLPTCSVTPTLAAQLVTKTYVDSTVSGGGSSLLSGLNSWTGNNYFVNDVSMASRLFVYKDVSMGGNLLLVNDASFNGNLYVKGNVNGINIGRGVRDLFTNISIGFQALNVSGPGASVAVGYQALNKASTFDGNNDAFGYQALFNCSTGINNTAIGYSALNFVTASSHNTAIGRNAGNGNTTVVFDKQGNHNTFLGAYTGMTGGNWIYSTAVGVDAIITASNQIKLGTNTQSVYCGENLMLQTASDGTCYIRNIETGANKFLYLGVGAKNVVQISNSSSNTTDYLQIFQYTDNDFYIKPVFGNLYLGGGNANLLKLSATNATVYGNVIVDSGKRVGIGITNPSYALSLGSVNANCKVAVYDDGTGNDWYGIGANSANLTFGAGLASAGTPQMVLNKDTGSVGIGTTTPTSGYKLDVVGTASATRFIGKSGGVASHITWHNATGAFNESSSVFYGIGTITDNMTFSANQTIEQANAAPSMKLSASGNLNVVGAVQATSYVATTAIPANENSTTVATTAWVKSALSTGGIENPFNNDLEISGNFYVNKGLMIGQFSEFYETIPSYQYLFNFEKNIKNYGTAQQLTFSQPITYSIDCKIGHYSAIINPAASSSDFYSNETIPFGTNFSICFWVKFTSIADTNKIIQFYNHFEDKINIRFNGTKIGLAVNGGTLISTAIDFVSNTWYHIGVTISGTSGIIYVNGSQDGSGTVNSLIGTPKTLYIASDPDSTTYLNILIDQLIFDNTVFTATNVSDIYNSNFKLNLTTDLKVIGYVETKGINMYNDIGGGTASQTNINFYAIGYNTGRIAVNNLATGTWSSSMSFYVAIHDQKIYEAIRITGVAQNDANCCDVKIYGDVEAVSYNAVSDYRVKENVVPINASFTVDMLNPVTYNLKNSGKQDIGFIAHEVQEFYPYLVNGVKDGPETQSLNYNGLIGILTKEIKDLKKEMRIVNDANEKLNSDVSVLRLELEAESKANAKLNEDFSKLASELSVLKEIVQELMPL